MHVEVPCVNGDDADWLERGPWESFFHRYLLSRSLGIPRPRKRGRNALTPLNFALLLYKAGLAEAKEERTQQSLLEGKPHSN